MPINVNSQLITAISCEGREIVRAHAGLDLVWAKQASNPFVMKFNITDNSLTLPFFNTTGHDCVINWGDGSSSTITSYSSPNRVHTYTTNGLYTVSISGICKGIYFDSSGDRLKLVEISSFGDVGMTSLLNAFNGCTNLTGELPALPSSVTAIGHNAFNGCAGLTGNLIIPSSVTEIGFSAFANCAGFTGNLVIPSSVTAIGISSFHGCTGLTGNLIIPSSVTSIGSSAFRSTGFTGELAIPNSIALIPDYAFYNVTGFTSLVIPSSVTSIGSSAFRGCNGLASMITVPSSVTSIGSAAFRSCSNPSLSYWFDAITPPTLGGAYVFDGANSAMRIKVPPSSVTAYKTASRWSSYASKIISQ